jgi:glucose 1-dehydrogenase
MLLSNKVAIVTGAGQGIGRACAIRVAAEGAKVLVADVNITSGAEVVAAIQATQGQATFLACDVSKSADVTATVAKAVATYGRVDLLVNNAGVVDDSPFLDLTEAEFDRIIGINLKGAFLMAQAVGRQFVKQGRDANGSAGSIVNMSSINAWFGLPDHAAYAMSKGGIMQLTKSMAVALAAQGIRVNAVGPGTIETPLSRTPLGRFGQPEEIAAVVVFLLSEQASYLTGTTIYADGGRMPLNYTVPVV